MMRDGCTRCPGRTPAGSSYDLALAQNGSPRAAYVGGGGAPRLVYAQDPGTGWTAAVVGEWTYAHTTHDVTLELDGSDRPTICFRAAGSNRVSIASTPGTAGVTSIPTGAPLTLVLASSNPSRGGGATWSVQLPEAGDVTLEAFDVSGRRISKSAPQPCSQGESLLEWDPAPRRAGTFFVRARVNGAVSGAVRWHAER